MSRESQNIMKYKIEQEQNKEERLFMALINTYCVVNINNIYIVFLIFHQYSVIYDKVSNNK